MSDLTRTEQEDLIRLLGVVIDNGCGGLEAQDDYVIWLEITALIQAAQLVRDACQLDLANQKG